MKKILLSISLLISIDATAQRKCDSIGWSYMPTISTDDLYIQGGCYPDSIIRSYYLLAAEHVCYSTQMAAITYGKDNKPPHKSCSIFYEETHHWTGSDCIEENVWGKWVRGDKEETKLTKEQYEALLEYNGRR